MCMLTSTNTGVTVMLITPQRASRTTMLFILTPVKLGNAPAREWGARTAGLIIHEAVKQDTRGMKRDTPPGLCGTNRAINYLWL